MSRTMLFIATISFLGCLTPSIAQDSRWGSPDDPIVKFIIAIEAKWASSSCSPQPDLKAIIADDFQGTTTNGHRYDKAEDGKEARRCQVWTDTWLKRNGQWQIVAAQDTVIPCP